MGVQEVRWDREGTVRAGDYNFFCGRGNDNHQSGTGLFVHHKIRVVSPVKRVKFVNDRVSYIQGGSNTSMTGTDLYVNKPHCAAAVRP